MSTETPSGMLLFLHCHGPLVEEYHDGGVRLTMEGRLFALSFLTDQKYITSQSFEEVREKVKGLGEFEIGTETVRMIAEAGKKWMDDHETVINLNKSYPPTDLPLNSIRALFGILIASQEKLEASLKPS